MISSDPSIPKFVYERAANSYELRNRDTNLDGDQYPERKFPIETFYGELWYSAFKTR